MRKYLKLNGKKLTKFDISQICSDTGPWRYTNPDHFTYDELVWLLYVYCKNLSNRSLAKCLRFYYGYGCEPEIRDLFEEDIARYNIM